VVKRPEAVPATVFELSAGGLCLDFANSWGDRGRPETDRLRSYADLLAFARQAGSVAAARLDGLEALAARAHRRATAGLARALELRESLYRIFSAGAAGRTVAPADLARLNAELAGAFRGARLAASGDDFSWRWDGEPSDLSEPLRPIARSAAELLTSAELGRVRECAGADCTWLFLDARRAGSRRWCSMASCGNRAKARRFYRRHRGGGLPG